MADTELVNDTIADLMRVTSNVKEDLNNMALILAVIINKNGGKVVLSSDELEAVKKKQLYWAYDRNDNLVVGLREQE